MNEIVNIFGEVSTKDLINGLRMKPSYDKSSLVGMYFYIEEGKTIQTSYKTTIEELKSKTSDSLSNDDLLDKIKKEIIYLKNNINNISDVNISKELTDVIARLGTQLYDNAATKEKIHNFESDFWFKRLRDLIHNDQAKTRKQFMRLATYWYVLIELEGYSEEEVVQVLASNKSKMKEIVEKWNVKHFSDFIEKVHYIASTKQIEHFINIIKNSSATNEVKEELINKLLTSNILDTWNN
ncbi:hypothetical protein AL503_002360 [Staphylococcus haemolyticus]|uniref:Uncharacterized protein n=1 Tax=Staphylococcus haemolyticus TaxID=1283 RepID=A0A2K0AX89_STAHA|nr:hypothetical protein AL503_002360 [Staphylococcus haemolyticus]